MPRWWNGYTHYLEGVALKGLEVQILSWAPILILTYLSLYCIFILIVMRLSR